VSQPWGSGAELTDEMLNREVFFTLKEAKVVIENWRREYNTIRPHSSLNSRPPLPEVTLLSDFQQPWLTQSNPQVASTLT
jgi:putative transposase